MIHTTLTLYSAEGIAVLVIVYTLGVAFLVFYYKWLRVNSELRRCRHSLEDKRKAKTSTTTADTKPISFGQIEPCSNDDDATAPATAPTIKLIRIPLMIGGMIRVRLSSRRGKVNQKRAEPAG